MHEWYPVCVLCVIAPCCFAFLPLLRCPLRCTADAHTQCETNVSSDTHSSTCTYDVYYTKLRKHTHATQHGHTSSRFHAYLVAESAAVNVTVFLNFSERCAYTPSTRHDSQHDILLRSDSQVQNCRSCRWQQQCSAARHRPGGKGRMTT